VAVDGPTGERDAPDEQPVREVPQAHDAPHDPDQPELLKAVGELAAENADLYRISHFGSDSTWQSVTG
jgi:hypothetical protein